MGESVRTVRLLTSDEALLASVRAAVKGLSGWELASSAGADELLKKKPVPGDAILLDHAARENVYEACRRLTGKTRCRTWVVAEKGNAWCEAIARFCGATGVLERPVSASDLRRALEGAAVEQRPLPADKRQAEGRAQAVLPEALLRDLAGKRDPRLIDALTDPETQLFNYAFLGYKLDEEFKRAQRFGHPLSCVMLGFEGQAAPQVLSELAGIFLIASRDTDVLGRFDESSFLFLLPGTGPDGARVMAQRVGDLAQERGLRDLVGDELSISVGIATYPHSEIDRREDLYHRAREAFLEARRVGGGVVTSP